MPIALPAQYYKVMVKIKSAHGTTLKSSKTTFSNGVVFQVNERENFQLDSLPESTYSIVVSSPFIDTLFHQLELTSDTSIVLSVEPKAVELGDVVITATRTERNANDLPIPVKVITGEQIEKMGAVRLSDVLREQTGLTLISDHGTGLQMQGMSSEYTLILLNGQPMIGRTAGTFDLERVAVGNIKRIEIIKGPSSSLYGSDALAGVVNIITEEPKYKQSNGELRVRYGSNQSLLTNGSVSYASRKFSSSLFLDRFSTAGYYLGESSLKIIPPHQQYTMQANAGWKMNSHTRLKGFVRGALQDQQAKLEVSGADALVVVDDISRVNDLNGNIALEHKLNTHHNFMLRNYSGFYSTTSDMSYESSGDYFDHSWFTQQLHRPEFQHQFRSDKGNELVSGLGYTYENVVATRYSKLQSFSSAFVFSSYEQRFGARVSVTAGGRFDVHSVYGNQFNPRLSVRWQVSPKNTFKISRGRGFKAPDFRQLYLNFTNASEGYTVLGTVEVKDQYAMLQQQGVISQPLTDIEAMKPLLAESSTAINASWEASFHKNFKTSVGVFRNDISNMIASQPIAIKTNGQSVYSYFNLSKVYTQGVEAEFFIQPFRSLRVSGGYQYLIAMDKKVLEDLEKGSYYRRDPVTYKTTKLSVQDYGGLFNRSKHMGNVKVSYENIKRKFDLNFRAIYRGRYGYGDLNGNLILDDEKEYVDSYWIFNFTAGKKMFGRFYGQVGVDNIFDFTVPSYVPTLPGRIYYVSLSTGLWKKKTTDIKTN